MTAYVIRRVLWGILLLVIVCALTFVMFRVLPTGNPAVLRAGREPAAETDQGDRSDARLEQTAAHAVLGLPEGVVLHFNFGYSYYSQESVNGLIVERLPATMSLTVGAAILWMVAGLGVGIISALRRHTLRDRAAMGSALVLVSAPEFWLGLIALLLFASDIGKFKIFPGAGSYVGLTYDPWKWFTSLIMPWLVLAAGSGGGVRAADPRQPARGDGRGLHPHRARQGAARARTSCCARRCAPRSTRS